MVFATLPSEKIVSHVYATAQHDRADCVGTDPATVQKAVLTANLIVVNVAVLVPMWMELIALCALLGILAQHLMQHNVNCAQSIHILPVETTHARLAQKIIIVTLVPENANDVT